MKSVYDPWLTDLMYEYRRVPTRYLLKALILQMVNLALLNSTSVENIFKMAQRMYNNDARPRVDSEEEQGRAAQNANQ